MTFMHFQQLNAIQPEQQIAFNQIFNPLGHINWTIWNLNLDSGRGIFNCSFFLHVCRVGNSQGIYLIYRDRLFLSHRLSLGIFCLIFFSSIQLLLVLFPLSLSLYYLEQGLNSQVQYQFHQQRKQKIQLFLNLI